MLGIVLLILLEYAGGEQRKWYVGPTLAGYQKPLVEISLEDVYLGWKGLLYMVLGSLLIILIGCVIFLSPFPDILRMAMPNVSPFIYHLNCFMESLDT